MGARRDTPLPRAPPPLQGGFAFKHKDNNLVVSAPEGVPLADIDGDRVKAEADALNVKKAAAVRGPCPAAPPPQLCGALPLPGLWPWVHLWCAAWGLCSGACAGASACV